MAVGEREKWDKFYLYIDKYFSAFPENNYVTAGQFFILIFSGVEVFFKHIKPKNFNELCNLNSFIKAIFCLKKRSSDLLSILMEEINFYYSNEKYISSEAELALTNLQNSKIISLNNPEFKTFKICLNEKKSKGFINRFINEHSNLGISEANIKQYSKMFLDFYIENSKEI